MGGQREQARPGWVGVILGGVIGVVSGVVITYFSNILTDSREVKNLARLLIVEVEANQIYLKFCVELGKKFYEGEENVILSNVDRLRLLKPSYLRTTIFTVTLQNQGILGETTLKPLHKFYSGLRQNLWVPNSPSPPDRTTEHHPGKGSPRGLGGFAALDPGGVPWFEQPWAMGRRGLPAYGYCWAGFA